MIRWTLLCGVVAGLLMSPSSALATITNASVDLGASPPTLTLQGFGFGSSQGEGSAFLAVNGQPSGSVQTWSEDLIQIDLTGLALVSGSYLAVVSPDSGPSQTLSVAVTSGNSLQEAWPMRCSNTSLAVDARVGLVCTSALEVPGGDFGPDDGVPSDFYFVVTDVYLEPATSQAETGFIGIELSRLDGAGPIKESVEFKLAADLRSETYSFRSAILLLEPGDYLEVANFPGSTERMAVHVTGYLTASPERLTF